MRDVVALLAGFVALTIAQSSTSASDSVLTLSGTNSASSAGGDYPTGSLATYASYTTTITQSTSNSYVTISGSANATALSTALVTETITTNGTTITTTSATQTILSGRPISSGNGTATRNSTSTSSSARPTNTTPCNGHAAFCNRKYSNITMITAHNSPFVRPGNAASNQALEVIAQLNDGIRMLQFQVHQPNGTDLYMCHTNCDLLNAGLLIDYLITVRQWLDAHPYEVVTILMGNYDLITPDNFVDPVRESGLLEYVYTPSSVPMGLDDWPTLGAMILGRQRVVMMLDYNADQEEIPWLLDEFGNMWETPFSPTDPTFPCTQQRPPNQDDAINRDRLYMANHNLNIEVAVAGVSLLIPAYTLLEQVNAVSGNMSLGGTADNCTTMWDRPPNFLLVDYYNFGNFNGSVFQVAANMNNVSYNQDSCCDTNGQQSAGVSIRGGFSLSSMAFFGILTLIMIL